MQDCPKLHEDIAYILHYLKLVHHMYNVKSNKNSVKKSVIDLNKLSPVSQVRFTEFESNPRAPSLLHKILWSIPASKAFWRSSLRRVMPTNLPKLIFTFNNNHSNMHESRVICIKSILRQPVEKWDLKSDWSSIIKFPSAKYSSIWLYTTLSNNLDWTHKMETCQ